MSSPAECIVTLPATYSFERRYVVHVLLEVFLGLRVEFNEHDQAETHIRLRGERGCLRLQDGLFALPAHAWLTADSIPSKPFPDWIPTDDGITATTVSRHLPVFFGSGSSAPPFVVTDGEEITLLPDILGSSFFLLTGYEEVANPAVDAIGRYPYESSVLRHQTLVERPLVDEYSAVLGATMRLLWPRLTIKEHLYRLVPSHDVDIPFAHAFTPFSRMLISCGADVLRRGSLLGPGRRVNAWLRTKRGDATADPANTFDMIMDLSEERGLRSEFNFIVAHTDPAKDGNYVLEHPWIERLMRRIHERGHRIGLHGSYGGYDNPAQVAREFQRLKSTCCRLGIDQPQHSRQHWLRWCNPRTMQALADAGIDVDGTLTFKTHAGFRRGTCRRFPAFNLLTRQQLSLWQQPLVVMDGTLLDKSAMHLGYGVAVREFVQKLKARVRLFGGEFTLLWHNSRLLDQQDILLYRDCLD